MQSFYWNQMSALRDQVAGLATAIGHPHARSLVIRRLWFPTGSNTPSSELIQIQPNPIITTVSPRTMSAFQGVSDIQIEADDFEIKGISHTYASRLQLGRDGTGFSYFVDAELSLDGQSIVKGIECDFVTFSRESTLTWGMVVRRRADGRPENTMKEYGI